MTQVVSAGPGVEMDNLVGDHEGEGMQDQADKPEIKYDAKGLVPCIVQEWNTGEVLMLAYMDAEALRRTLETGSTWFYSRSRQEYWNKGATSGHFDGSALRPESAPRFSFVEKGRRR
jgi:hypothetical protein